MQGSIQAVPSHGVCVCVLMGSCVVRLFIVISRLLEHKWPNGAPFHNSTRMYIWSWVYINTFPRPPCFSGMQMLAVYHVEILRIVKPVYNCFLGAFKCSLLQ